MAPNVTASEIINSHIVSLREGIEYGDSSISAPPCPCMAISDSLTVPPISKRLQFRAQNKQQIEPQNSMKCQYVAVASNVLFRNAPRLATIRPITKESATIPVRTCDPCIAVRT